MLPSFHSCRHTDDSSRSLNFAVHCPVRGCSHKFRGSRGSPPARSGTRVIDRARTSLELDRLQSGQDLPLQSKVHMIRQAAVQQSNGFASEV